LQGEKFRSQVADTHTQVKNTHSQVADTDTEVKNRRNTREKKQMANYVLQELHKEMGNGKKPVYPKIQTYSLHDFETVIEHMRAYAGSLSEGTIRAVIDALIQTMKSWMPLGHNIKIDGLGIFSLSLGFDMNSPTELALAKNGGENGEAKDAKTKYRHVCIKGINFKPDAQLLKDFNSEATFTRVESGVVSSKRCTLKTEEKISRALAIIDKQGYMTLSDYAIATGQSRTTASQDLKRLVAQEKSDLTTRGSGSHKIWVRGGV
jgi:predicted histone-like DNA-binding protein